MVTGLGMTPRWSDTPRGETSMVRDFYAERAKVAPKQRSAGWSHRAVCTYTYFQPGP